MKMHEDQLDVDASLVRGLLTDQFPELARLPMTPVRSTGTVNALFRLGEDLCARLPLRAKWGRALEEEWEWLPAIARTVSTVGIPEPIHLGRPAEDYPLPWAIYRWIDGASYDDGLVDDERSAAVTLASFVRELRATALVEGAPAAGRDPLRELDDDTRDAIEASSDHIDAPAAMAMWQACVEAPAWDSHAVWIHSDLLRPNLLVRDGVLVAVIDFGMAGVGDPATDLIPAWSVFGPAGRETFRSGVGGNDAAWMRARGIALHQAAMIIPYYKETNPAFVTTAKRTIEQILADPAT